MTQRRAPPPTFAAIFAAHPGWEAGRSDLLCQDTPCCMRCGRFTDDRGTGLIKAHIQAHRDGGSDTEPANFWALCPSCHGDQPDHAGVAAQEFWRITGPNYEKEAWARIERIAADPDLLAAFYRAVAA